MILPTSNNMQETNSDALPWMNAKTVDYSSAHFTSTSSKLRASETLVSSAVGGSRPFRLVRQGLGAIPIFERVIERLKLLEHLTQALGQVRYAEAILLLLKNVLIERNALYAIQEWATQYDPALVYAAKYGDDVLARALDRLFAADRASLLTQIVLAAIRAYALNVAQIHQDTTSVKLSGAYQRQNLRAVQLKRGHSKDHRPDLLQLIYELSVTRDGAVPVLFKVHDGNCTDDGLHWENWQMLRGLLGRSDFLYVADCKLCVHETMTNIDRAQGRFLTVVPGTRGEVEDFARRVEDCQVRWEHVLSLRSSRSQKRIDRFEAASGVYQLAEGFRVFWFRSSEKARRDYTDREDRIAAALERLEALTDPQRKKKPRTTRKLRQKAEAIVARFAVRDWVKYEIKVHELEDFRQATPGRPTSATMYRRRVRRVARLTCQRDEIAIHQAELMDGIFPLTTNAQLDAKTALRAYKYQPRLEKRHALLKSGLRVAPIFLKKNRRVEALMFVYFLTQLVGALVERQLRKAMREQGIVEIQILPEDRPSATPTREQLIRVFALRHRHLLFSEDGRLLQTFSNPLTPVMGDN
jgi:transposase